MLESDKNDNIFLLHLLGDIIAKKMWNSTYLFLFLDKSAKMQMWPEQERQCTQFSTDDAFTFFS